MSSKFVTREMTVREMILCHRISKGDFESVVALVEARLAEPIPDLLEMSSSDFNLLVNECSESLNAVAQQTAALVAILTNK